ncbi:V-set domain containing T-cell activation inhibitor 1-like [Pempheris klunzingeri]|uniref:V-set domain containing T-cell activation inhibitor 1-like n=1 Tax=Pempheris klunzingeri TaxID=3127111 RepID=UPI00397E9434
MYFSLFVGAALLTCCTGESSEKIVALAGATVVLPCSFNISHSNDFPTVEWSKDGLKPNVVFLYRDGCETYEMKNPAFEYRTSLITKELKDGNVSLRISNVQLTDAGTYRCMRLWTNVLRDITTMELVVDAVSEPKLLFISSASRRVTLQCEAGCWLPVPHIEFLDNKGKVIPADHPKQDEDASGCYTVTRNVTLQDATNRVTCRVHQPETNRTRTTQILIPVDCMSSCSLTTGIAVGEAVLLLAFVCGLVVFKQCGGKCRLQSSGHSTKSSVSENEMLPMIVSTEGADNMGNSREVADLKSKLAEKEETIRQLQNNNRSQISPAVSYHDHPTAVHRPSTSSPDVPKPLSPPSDRDLKPAILQQNSCQASGHVVQRIRLHSSPAVLHSSSSVNNPKEKLGHKGRTMSDCCTRSRPGVNKAARRQSLASPSRSNDSTLLALLSEESE